MPIKSSRAGHPWDTLSRAYDVLRVRAVGGDEVFGQPVLARRSSPIIKLDCLRYWPMRGSSRFRYRTYCQPHRAPAGLRGPCVAAAARGGMCGARGAWAAEAGGCTTSAPCTSRPISGPRAGVLQGTSPGPADHHRACSGPKRGTEGHRSSPHTTPCPGANPTVNCPPKNSKVIYQLPPILLRSARCVGVSVLAR